MECTEWVARPITSTAEMGRYCTLFQKPTPLAVRSDHTRCWLVLLQEPRQAYSMNHAWLIPWKNLAYVTVKGWAVEGELYIWARGRHFPYLKHQDLRYRCWFGVCLFKPLVGESKASRQNQLSMCTFTVGVRHTNSIFLGGGDLWEWAILHSAVIRTT